MIKVIEMRNTIILAALSLIILTVVVGHSPSDGIAEGEPLQNDWVYLTLEGPNQTLSSTNLSLLGPIEVQKVFSYPVIDTGSSWGSDTFIRESGNILFEPEDTDARYKMFYTGYSKGLAKDEKIHYAYSTDGENWTKSPINPVISRRAEDPFVVVFEGQYFLFAEDKAGGGKDIRRWHSSDCLQWIDDGIILTTSEGSWDDLFVASPAIWIKGSKWFMLYEGAGTIEGRGKSGLATSDDGISWEKYHGNPVLSPEDTSWVEGSLVVDDVLIMDGVYYQFYHGRMEDRKWNAGVAFSLDGYAWEDSLSNPISFENVRNIKQNMVLFDTNFHFYYYFEDRCGIYLGTPEISRITTSLVSISPATIISFQELLPVNDTEPQLHSLWYSIDMGPFVLFEEPFRISEEGYHEITVNRSNDPDSSEKTFTYVFQVDETPPVTDLILDDRSMFVEQGVWLTSSTQLRFDVRDNSQIHDTPYETWYRIDSSVWLLYESPIQIPAEGSITIEYWSQDVLGNSELPQSTIVIIDRTPPSLEWAINGPRVVHDQRIWVSDSTTLILNAVDKFPFAGYEPTIHISIDGMAFEQYINPIPILKEGPHDIIVYATSPLGFSGARIIIKLHVDSTNPSTSIKIEGPRSGNASMGPIFITPTTEIHLQSNDGQQAPTHSVSTRFRLDGGIWTRYSVPIQFFEDAWDGQDGNPNGNRTQTHEIEYFSTDLVGNAEVVKSLLVTIDLSPPVISGELVGPWFTERNLTWVSPITVFAMEVNDVGDSASGLKGIDYRIDEGDWTPCGPQFTFWDTGCHTLTIRSSDNVDNTAFLHFGPVSVDSSPPLTGIHIDQMIVIDDSWTHLVRVSTQIQFICTDFGPLQSGVLDTWYQFSQEMPSDHMSGTWICYDGTILLPDPGNHILRFFSRDRVFNSEPPQYRELFLFEDTGSNHESDTSDSTTWNDKNEDGSISDEYILEYTLIIIPSNDNMTISFELDGDSITTIAFNSDDDSSVDLEIVEDTLDEIVIDSNEDGDPDIIIDCVGQNGYRVEYQEPRAIESEEENLRLQFVDKSTHGDSLDVAATRLLIPQGQWYMILLEFDEHSIVMLFHIENGVMGIPHITLHEMSVQYSLVEWIRTTGFVRDKEMDIQSVWSILFQYSTIREIQIVVTESDSVKIIEPSLQLYSYKNKHLISWVPISPPSEPKINVIEWAIGWCPQPSDPGWLTYMRNIDAG